MICVQNLGAGTGCARIVSSRGTGHTAFDVIGIYSEASDHKRCKIAVQALVYSEFAKTK